MSTVLETLSITELTKRKNDLIIQLKRVDDELLKRNIEIKENTYCKIKIKINKINKISSISNTELV